MVKKTEILVQCMGVLLAKGKEALKSGAEGLHILKP